MSDIISPKLQILAQITVNERNELGIGTKLKKEQLINLLLDIVKTLINQQDNKIITP